MATAKTTAKASAKTAANKKDSSKKSASAATATKTKKISAKRALPGEDEIRMKAQEIYITRISRGEYGTPEEDWLNAEKQLRS